MRGAAPGQQTVANLPPRTLNLRPEPASPTSPTSPGLRALLSATPRPGRCFLPPGLPGLVWQPEGYVARSSFTHPLPQRLGDEVAQQPVLLGAPQPDPPQEPAKDARVEGHQLRGLLGWRAPWSAVSPLAPAPPAESCSGWPGWLRRRRNADDVQELSTALVGD